MVVPAEAVFIAADEPLLVYRSAVAAQHDLEAIDVADGVYTCVFGPRGESYSIQAVDGDGVLIERTGESAKPDDLRKLLRHYLRVTDHPLNETASLDELVAAVWAIKMEPESVTRPSLLARLFRPRPRPRS